MKQCQRIPSFLSETRGELFSNEVYVYTYMLLLYGQDDYIHRVVEIFKGFDPSPNAKSMKSIYCEPDYDLLNGENIYRQEFRKLALLTAAQFEHMGLFQDILEQEDTHLVVTIEDLNEFYKFSPTACLNFLKYRVKIQRVQRSSVTTLLDYYKDGFARANLYTTQEKLDSVDIIEVLLDHSAPDFQILNLLEKSKDLEKPICLLIMKQKFELASAFLLHSKNTDSYKNSSLELYAKIAIENDSYDILKFLKKLFPLEYVASERTFLIPLMTSFQRSNRMWIDKVQLLKSLMGYTTYIKMEGILIYMLRALEHEEIHRNPLYYSANILLLACNIVELCRLSVTKYNFLEAYTQKIEELVIGVTATFIEEMEDEIQLRAMVFEKDDNNKDSIELITKYNIIKIMNNKNMEKIALELWTSDYDVKGSFMTTSSALKIIMYDSFNKPRDVISDYMFFNWKFRSMENFEHHLYQFEVWKKSMKAKFIVEGLFLAILTVIFQYYLLDAIQAANSVNESYNSFNTNLNTALGQRMLRGRMLQPPPTNTQNQTQTTSSPGGFDISSLDSATQQQILDQYSSFEGQAYQYFESMQVTVFFGFIAMTFALKVLLVMAFSYKTKQEFKFFTVNNILDLIIFTLFLIRVILEYSTYINGVYAQDSNADMGQKYYENIFEEADHEVFLAYLYCVASTCLWLRIILMFRLTRFLGPLIKMIQSMIFDISVFIVLYSAQMIVFASIGNLLFTDVDEYGDFYSAIKTLFLASLGSFDFDTLKDNSKGSEVGDIYIIVFVVVNNVLLLNLLIAILSSTYAMLEDKKLVLYINEILKLRPTLAYNKMCSSLVASFPPWNIVPFAFTPFIMAKKNSSKLNEVVFHFEYVPIMLLFLLIYSLIHILLIPIAYLKGIIIKVQLLANKNLETSVFSRILGMFFFIFFGLFIL
jgi:hypothetical protein